MKKEYIILSVLFVVVVVVVVVVIVSNGNSNSENKKSGPRPGPVKPPVPPTPGPKPGPVGPPVPPTPGPMPGPKPGPMPLTDPVKMNDTRFDFSIFDLQKEELFCYYSDKFRYGSASNCGLVDFRYEVILLEQKTKPTEWKVIIAIRQYKDEKLSEVQYFESKPLPSDVSCLINDSFVEKYYKLCETTVDECVTQADKSKVGYEGTTCPEEFYVDVEYMLIKKLGDINSQGCVPKNFKIKKSSSTGEVMFSNNSEDSDGKEYTTEKIKIKK